MNSRGTLDLNPDKFAKMLEYINIIRTITRRMDIAEIDTPIMEKSTLLNRNYDEETTTKQIFDLKDNQNSLRYDLTVPLVRYMSNNGLDNIRRFQVGKVFRRDTPEISRGRFCEFYQADIDIVGEYPMLMPEIEIFTLIQQILNKFNITEYIIKYNYRQTLFAICQIVEAPEELFQPICRTIDKLDKSDWDTICRELHEIVGLTIEQSYEIKTIIESDFLPPNLTEFDMMLNESVEGLTRDASLARGLDYYTGIIYEVVIPNSDIKTIIAGGRYDKLVYKTRKGKKVYFPAIGVSFGLSRMFNLIDIPIENNMPKIYVISNNIQIMFKILKYFRNINCLTTYDRLQRKTIKQISSAVKNNYDYVVVYGEDAEQIRVKNLKNDEEDELFELEVFEQSEQTLIIS
jgi:histidyl-tRNA synthetase